MRQSVAAASIIAALLIQQIQSTLALSLNDVLSSLDKVKSNIDSKLFLYQTPAYQWVPSSVYRYDDFRESLSVMAEEGVAGKKFYIGEDVENGYVYGLVNIAAFLAQSMKETIQYDACDENSWDLVGGKYPLSNACGQLGQNYQDYHCPPEEKHMECEVDPNMSIVGVTHAKWYGAPGPMFCGPKTSDQPHSGFWDHSYECNKSWASPPETCDVYEGQKAGRYDQSRPHANTAGRTDVEGCCWWGRGVIQTSGVCNFGKLNYYLGAKAKSDGRNSKYPQVDFCKDPEVICSSPEHKELKWIAGEFYWTESVQAYKEGGWDYTLELIKFVDGGMNGNQFINAVSGIVNRGCHNPPCGTGALDGGHERAENFKKVLDVFFGGSPPQVGSSPSSSGFGPGSSGSGASGSGSSGASVATLDWWYPDYNSQYSLGKCINNAPAPSGRPSYNTGVECCDKAYPGQASGACLDSLRQDPSSQVGTYPGTPSGQGLSVQGHQPTPNPFSPSQVGTSAGDLTGQGLPTQGPQPQTTTKPVSPSQEVVGSSPGTPTGQGVSVQGPQPTPKPVSPASEVGMFISSQTLLDMGESQRNTYISYKCSSTDIPTDSLVVDILFDYEVFIMHTQQASHVLPDLKKQIMNDLAHTLSCEVSLQRRLPGNTDRGLLLGYYSGEGSDVVDGEKGSCNEYTEEVGSQCVPVVGNLAAILTSNASTEDVMGTKSIILASIQDVMADNKAHIAQHTIYIGEHKDDQNQLANNDVSDEETPTSNTPWLGILFALLAALLVLAMVLMLQSRKKKLMRVDDECHKNEDEDHIFEDTSVASLDGSEDGSSCLSIKDDSSQDNVVTVYDSTPPAVSDSMLSNVMDAHSDTGIQLVDTAFLSSDRPNAQIELAATRSSINIEESKNADGATFISSPDNLDDSC